MGITDARGSELVARAERIAEEVAGIHADNVDRDARFPVETLDVLREEGFMAALVPPDLGGAGATLGQVADITRALGTYCASTAIIFAVHQTAVACIATQRDAPFFHDFLVEVAESQLLLGSAMSEVSVDGDGQASLCSVDQSGQRFTLVKEVPVLLYGAYADAILTTAHRARESTPTDQVLVLCRAPGLVLEQSCDWDTLGLRGTCGLGFRLSASGDVDQILRSSFGEIWPTTMAVGYTLWSAAGLGIASAASERARHFMRGQERKNPSLSSPGSERLTELTALHQQMNELVRGASRRYDARFDDRAGRQGMSLVIALKNARISAAKMAVDIVSRAMMLCGMAAYRLDAAHCMSRHLRDAYGVALLQNANEIIAEHP